jgi:hypothetical protein
MVFYEVIQGSSVLMLWRMVAVWKVPTNSTDDDETVE